MAMVMMMVIAHGVTAVHGDGNVMLENLPTKGDDHHQLRNDSNNRSHSNTQTNNKQQATSNKREDTNSTNNKQHPASNKKQQPSDR